MAASLCTLSFSHTLSDVSLKNSVYLGEKLSSKKCAACLDNILSESCFKACNCYHTIPIPSMYFCLLFQFKYLKIMETIDSFI